MGIVPVFILFNKASVNAFLDLALDFFNLFLWSGIGTTPHSRLFKLSISLSTIIKIPRFCYKIPCVLKYPTGSQPREEQGNEHGSKSKHPHHDMCDRNSI